MKRPIEIGIVLVVGSLSPALSASSAAGGGIPDTGALLLQTFIGLVLVVLMILGLAWLAKRANLVGFSRVGHCKILATLPLSAREKAVVVDIGGQQLLLGVAPGNVTTLHVFENPVIVAPPTEQGRQALKSYSRLAASSPAEFSRKLSEFLGQGNKQG